MLATAVPAPRFNLELRVPPAYEPMFVQVILAKPAIEASDLVVVGPFPRPTEVNCDFVFVSPAIQHFADELAAVVAPAASLNLLR